MVKAVIFDFDGLLADTEIISYQIFKEIAAKYGYEFTEEEYARNYSGRAGSENISKLIGTYKLPLTPEEGLAEVLRLQQGFLARGVSLKPGAKKLLSFLKENGYQIAMASSSREDRALTILRQHGAAGYFDSFVFGAEVQNGKPHPDIFLKACEKLGQEPGNCLVLEDSEAGIQAAYAANIPVICIPDIKMPGKQFLDQTTAVMSSLNEVIPFLSNAKNG